MRSFLNRFDRGTVLPRVAARPIMGFGKLRRAGEE